MRCSVGGMLRLGMRREGGVGQGIRWIKKKNDDKDSGGKREMETW